MPYAAVLILALAGCGAPVPLPPPGTGGAVAVQLWEADATAPTVLVADRIRQEGLRFDSLGLDGVRARVISSGLDCAITAPSGSWQVRSGLLVLAGPVHLAGSWQGRPMLGVASSATLSRRGQTITLNQLELWNQGQRLLAPVAELHRDRSLVAPNGLDSSPLPPELATVFAALPDPLVLPR